MIQDCNTQMIKEIDFRKSELTDKKKQYEALNANDLDEDYIGSIKEKDIKEQINKILNESIPLEPDK